MVKRRRRARIVPRRTQQGSRELTSVDSIALPGRASARRRGETPSPRPRSAGRGAHSAARSSRSCRTSVHGAHLEEVQRIRRRETRDRRPRSDARGRAAGSRCRTFAGRLREEREELAAVRRRRCGRPRRAARFLGARVAEKPQVRGQHDHPVSQSSCRPTRGAGWCARGARPGRSASCRRRAPAHDVVEPDWLAGDADGEELLARPELFRRGSSARVAEPHLPLKVHAPDKHERRGGHNWCLGVELRGLHPLRRHEPELS